MPLPPLSYSRSTCRSRSPNGCSFDLEVKGKEARCRGKEVRTSALPNRKKCLLRTRKREREREKDRKNRGQFRVERAPLEGSSTGLTVFQTAYAMRRRTTSQLLRGRTSPRRIVYNNRGLAPPFDRMREAALREPAIISLPAPPPNFRRFNSQTSLPPFLRASTI